ncbi:MAG: LysR family transcriptional regulator [Burkholderiaceae bacterium]
MSLNLNHLKTFSDVIELGSFSAAARRQNLSQPAVSLQIRQLEKRLGVALIERVGRTARPTAAGAELLFQIRQIDGAVVRTLEAMAPYAGGAMGRVRIGTGATACMFVLPPVLRAMREAFSKLEITVTTGNSLDIIHAIEENQLDLGLVTMPVGGRSLDVRPVLKDEFVLIAPSSMTLPLRLTPSALAALPLLLFEPGGNTRRIVDQWFAQHGVALTPVMALGSVGALQELVRAGLGCAILPGMAVPGPKEREGLKVRFLSPRLHRRLAVVVRRDKPLYRGLKELREALLALGSEARTATRPG